MMFMGATIIKTNKKKLILWILAIMISSSLFAFLTMIFLTLNKDTIYPQVYIEGMDVSNLSKEEAKSRLKAVYEKELEDLKIDLVYGNYNKDINYKDLDYQYLYNESIEAAYARGREGSLLNRIKEIYNIKNEGINIPLQRTYDDKKLDDIVIEVNDSINKDAVDANIRRQGGIFHITDEITGFKVEEESLVEAINNKIQNLNTETLEIPVTVIEPKIKGEALKNIKDIIGEFSTVFNAQVAGRSKNIDIATNSITHTLLMPGEEFSFNQKTGPRGIKEGYQEAPVIVNGQLVPGVGGGICQVSTTLYNAVVRANLEISNRRNHSIPVGYVPLGHDATVSYGYIDFKFINNRKYPVYIESYISGNRVFTKLYGVKEDNVAVTLYSEVTEVIEPKTEIKVDNDLFIGEKKVEKVAKQGYRVNTYKIYSQGGKEIKREHISKDYYAPVNGIVIEGGKEKPADVSIEEKEQDTEVIQEETPLDENTEL